MKNVSKRLFCLVLALVMVVGVLPVMAMAAEDPVKATITSGTPVGIWQYDRVGSTSGIAPESSYDDSLTTQWNPQAFDGVYSDGEGIVYTLDKEYDVTKISVTFMRKHYFQVLVSNDGVNYDVYATVTADNETKYMEVVEEAVAGKPTVRYNFGFGVSRIQYVKILFNGNVLKSQWISLYDTTVMGTPSAEVSAELPVIVRGELVGSWLEPQTGTSNSVFSSYDNSATSMWNPGAQGNFVDDPGVVYTLKNAVSIEKMEFDFGSATNGTRTYYFDVFVSADGADYTPVAMISAKNETKAYPSGTGLCVLDGLNLTNVKYVKVIFRERKSGADYVALQNVAFSNEGTDGLDTSWMLPVVDSAEVIGTWLNDQTGTSQSVEKAFDDNPATLWNPGADQTFSGDPGVIFTLTKAMDLNKMVFNFGDKTDGTRTYYFDVYVSEDGSEYVPVAVVSEKNETKAYPNGDGVCTLDGLNLENVKYVKVIFNARKSGLPWVALCEVSFSETGTSGADTSWMLPVIMSAQISGEWNNDQTGTAQSVEKAFDGDVTTAWNPGAKNHYPGEPGVVFTLAQKSDLTKLELTFGVRYAYFDAAVSADGITYIPVASVRASNAAKYYTNGYVCTIDGLNVENIQYIKLTFVGDSDNEADATKGLWVTLYEIGVTGEKSVNKNAVYAAITDATPIGTWIDDRTSWIDAHPTAAYDASLATLWNPQATSVHFEDGEGIIYTLDKFYDVSQLSLTFMRNHYFTLQVSANNIRYRTIAVVNADNADSAFTVIDDSVDGKPVVRYDLDEELEGVKYIKILFTGNAARNSYVSLYDIHVKGVNSVAQEFVCEHDNIVTETVEATCVANGSVTTLCDNCGEVYSVQTLPATGIHSYGEWKVDKPATYTEAGSKSQTCIHCGDVNTAEIPVLEMPAISYNIILRDKISVNFQIELEETDVVTVTVGGDAADFDRNGNAISVDVAAAQMTDIIVISINGVALPNTYSVRGYADYILDEANGFDDTTKNLVKAMLCYGGAAQVYFEYNTESFADANIEMTAQAPAGNAVLDVNGNLDGIQFYGASVVHKNRIAVRFYFTGSIEGLTFSQGTPVEKNGMYYIEVADINPQDIGNVIEIEVSDGTDSLTVSYSVLSYIVRMYEKADSSAATKALVKALYNYYLAALAYTN